ncbi:MAG TPA: hypothetical protein PLB05_02160 [Candidatus Omnitrophota bacterium]|nr:hypothetical protein [Candidatus Omnitrophota bacterium]HPN56800.1 hypothetical protein [Candidatus Omnitrophota bacterium]
MLREKLLWWGGVLVILQLFLILGMTLTETKTAVMPVKEADAQCVRFWLDAANNAVPGCAGGVVVSYVYSGTVPVYGGSASRYVALCSI